MRAPTLATSALILLLAACSPPTDNTSRSTDPVARPPATTSTTTPGDGPDPHPHGTATAPGDEAAAALVAAGFAAAAYTANADIAARVAPYATERLLSEYSGPAATADSTPEEQPVNVLVESVHPLAPTGTRWRFEVVLTAIDTTPPGPRTRTAVLTIDVADTSAGPRVDAAR